MELLSSQMLTSLVLVLCREYTVRAFLMPLVTNSASMPVLRVPNGGFIRIVSKPVHGDKETRMNGRQLIASVPRSV